MKWDTEHEICFVNGYPVACSMMGQLSIWYNPVTEDDILYCRIMHKGSRTYCTTHNRPVRLCQERYGGMAEKKRRLIGWACPECGVIFPAQEVFTG